MFQEEKVISLKSILPAAINPGNSGGALTDMEGNFDAIGQEAGLWQIK